MEEQKSEIREFFKDRNVFITGGTGFLGKVLIEKLLRSTDVAAIFVMIREKKGKSAHTRVDDIFDDALFDRLKREKPKFKNRMEAIPGDCSLSGFGLSISDRHKLITSIDVVIHAAATVNFNEPLGAAYGINVAGTRTVLELARQMESLRSIVHISTAYSHCPRAGISEEFYDCPVEWGALGAFLDKATDSEAGQLTPRLLGCWPNTYTFTKALSESVVKELGEGLPIGVFRPGIVISTFRDPVPGWIDNLYGPTGVAAGALGGALRAMRVRGGARADVVPVDTCAAAILAVAKERGVCERRNSENIPIYNYVSSPENPITWEEYIQLNVIHGKAFPYSNALWSIHVAFTSSLPLYLLLRTLLHTVPALLLDLVLLLTGQSPRMLGMYKKIHKFSDILQYFCMRDWHFSNRNVVNLWEKTNAKDRELFPFSLTTVQWLVYLRGYIYGVRKYLLKDGDDTLEYAKNRNWKMNVLNEIFKLIFLFVAVNFVVYVCCKVVSLVF